MATTPRESVRAKVGDNAIDRSNLDSPFRVATIAALKAIDVTKCTNGQLVEVINYSTSNDGGGGEFSYSSSSVVADDGGVTIAPTTGSGRWIRQVYGSISVKLFGAKGDGATNDTTAIQGAVNASIVTGRGEVVIPSGSYLVDNIALPYSAGKNFTIRGLGKWAVSGGSLTQYGARLVSNSAVPIFTPANGCDGIKISNLVLDGNSVGTYGYYGAFGSFNVIEDCCALDFVNDGYLAGQGLCQLRFCYSVGNGGNGATWAGDGRVIGNWLSSNTGSGLKMTAGGTFIANNELAFNGIYGLFIDGTGGSNNSNHEVCGNYVEDNVAGGILVSGQNSGNRNANKIKLTDNYVSSAHLVAGAVFGIKVAFARSVQISSTVYLGADGNNTAEIQGLLIQSCDTVSVNGYAAEDGQVNVIKLVDSVNVTLNNIVARDCAQSGTSADNSYGIYVDATSSRCSISNVQFTDYRGTTYMRGIKALVAINLSNYQISTAVATPDSFTGGSLVYTDSAGNPTVSASNAAFASLIAQQNASVKNYTSRGQISIAGGVTDTLFTLDNSSTNRTWILTIRQAAAGTANYACAMVIAYGANASAATIMNDSANTALQFVWSTTGLAVKVTPGAGYGATTWDWVLTPLG